MEEINNFRSNVASFLLMSGLQRWYTVEAYVPPNNTPAVHSVEQALAVAPKGMGIILFRDFNAQFQLP